MSTLPRGLPFTRADLDAMPDDGRRHEIVDGTLVVTPAPSVPHQRVVRNLTGALLAACPDDLEVLFAPLDVVLAVDTVVQPDLLVARRADLTERDLPAAPVLAVEVLSPSTRRIDLTLKRARYEAAGCPSYWAVDPDQPSVTVWDLIEGRYVETGRASREERLEVTAPYALTLVPGRLAG